MYQRIPAVKKVLSKPVPVPGTIKRLPTCDIPPVRCIVNNILRFLKIHVTTTRGKRIVIKSQDDINIIGNHGSKISNKRIGSRNPVFIEFQLLELGILERDLIILEIDNRR